MLHLNSSSISLHDTKIFISWNFMDCKNIIANKGRKLIHNTYSNNIDNTGRITQVEKSFKIVYFDKLFILYSDFNFTDDSREGN